MSLKVSFSDIVKRFRNNVEPTENFKSINELFFDVNEFSEIVLRFFRDNEVGLKNKTHAYETLHAVSEDLYFSFINLSIALHCHMEIHEQNNRNEHQEFCRIYFEIESKILIILSRVCQYNDVFFEYWDTDDGEIGFKKDCSIMPHITRIISRKKRKDTHFSQ